MFMSGFRKAEKELERLQAKNRELIEKYTARAEAELADYQKAKQYAIGLLEAIMPEAEPFDHLSGLLSQLDHAFATTRAPGLRFKNDREWDGLPKGDLSLRPGGTKGWRVGMARCRTCGTRWVAVYPADTLAQDLECPTCGTQDAEVEG